MRVFSGHSMKQLLYLYAWRGEAVNLKELTTRSALDVDDQKLTSIREKLHELLIHLTTSNRLGLVFTDRRRDLDRYF